MLRAAIAFFVALLYAGGSAPVGQAGAPDDDAEKTRKPKFSLKGSPAISFSPSRVSFTAELVGGADDYEEYYCPSLEWDWGDGTESEASQDCEPYEEGKSEIKRRYSAVHTYQYAGRYTVVLRLKRNDKVLVASNTSIQVRPGARDMMGGGW